MDLREILFAQFPAFFLLSLLFLIAHLRVRKHSAVKSVLWVLLFGAALAVSILFCFLGMQAKYWTVKTLRAQVLELARPCDRGARARAAAGVQAAK